MRPVEQRVKELLEAGSRSTHRKTRHTCQRILKLWGGLWTFVRVEGVEPTNNAAERALRRAVLWRRKSFGTQSEAGSRFVERILTVVTTLRQQRRDVLDYLTAACRAAVAQSSPGSLLPDTS
jgi:transposase